MNKKLMFIVILTASLFAASCEKNQKENKDEVMDSILVKELNDLNNELISSLPQTRITAKEFILLASADVSGARTGGEIGFWVGTKVGIIMGNPITGGVFGAFLGAMSVGAVASWAAYPEGERTLEDIDYGDIVEFSKKAAEALYDEIDLGDLFEDDEDYEDYAEEEDDEQLQEMLFVEECYLEDVSLSPKELYVGKMHNLMLANLEGVIKTEHTRSASTRVSEEIDEDKGEYAALSDAILESDEMRQAFYEYFESDEEVIDNTLPGVVTTLFTEVLQVYPESIEDVVYLINVYLERIDASSELSSDEKTWIRLGMAVSLYSYNYWSKK